MNRLIKIIMLAATCGGFAACSFSIFPELDLPKDSADVRFAERAARENPQNAHAWFLIGKEKLREGETDEARQAFEKAKDLDPTYAEPLIGIGKTYLVEENWRRAASAFRNALEMRPNSPAAQEGLAEAQYGDGDLTEAKSTAESAVNLKPNSFTGHLTLGNIAYIFEEYDAALSHWERASESGELPPDVLAVMADLEQYVQKYR